MLDRLSTAFAAQREFVADASHELRTPLTVLRGQLDVLTGGDRDDGSLSGDELERVQRLMEAEIARLSRLVDDLLLLVQSDRDDFLRLTPRAARRARHRALGRPQSDRRARLQDRTARARDRAGRPRSAGAGPAQPRSQRDRADGGAGWTGRASTSPARRRDRAHHRQRRRPRDPARAAPARVRTLLSHRQRADARRGRRRAWGSRSCRRSPRPTTARSGSPTRRPAERRSRWTCRSARLDRQVQHRVLRRPRAPLPRASRCGSTGSPSSMIS